MCNPAYKHTIFWFSDKRLPFTSQHFLEWFIPVGMRGSGTISEEKWSFRVTWHKVLSMFYMTLNSRPWRCHGTNKQPHWKSIEKHFCDRARMWNIATILDETLDKMSCAYFEGIFLNMVQTYPLQIILPPPFESMLLCLQKSASTLGVCA